MTQVILIRHCENEFVRTGRLAGWTPGVHLNDFGSRQAELLGARLSSVKLKALYSSPLERAVETAEAIAKLQSSLIVRLDARIGEVRYGGWTGKRLKQLATTKLWQKVQRRPSMMRFPDGETFREVQVRAVDAVESVIARFPRGAVAMVSHGDVIKTLVAYFAGIHLDNFQRLLIDTASISIINFSNEGTAIARVNDTSHTDTLRKT